MKAITVIFVIISLVTLYGCAALVVGGAAGAGTAVWLGGKLTQTVQAPYERTVNAAKSALVSLNLEVTKETKDKTVTQIKSKYTDGREVWIDIRPVTESSSKIEVRVGLRKDTEASDRILKRILQYL